MSGISGRRAVESASVVVRGGLEARTDGPISCLVRSGVRFRAGIRSVGSSLGSIVGHGADGTVCTDSPAPDVSLPLFDELVLRFCFLFLLLAIIYIFRYANN
ncbi:MAG: hypothetical protein P8I74_02285, partial [Phycisphaerales bacterium]|nr:hypothetical protein [Phycisphaerales bacterium]